MARDYMFYWDDWPAIEEAHEFLSTFEPGSQERSVANWSDSQVRHRRLSSDFQAMILKTALKAGWSRGCNHWTQAHMGEEVLA